MADVPGTIVGFWSPPYARSINVAGWHLHFLTDDRKGGGHLLGCSGAGLEAKMEDLDDLRLAIPETTQFLHADLTQDPSQALDQGRTRALTGLSRRPDLFLQGICRHSSVRTLNLQCIRKTRISQTAQRYRRRHRRPGT